MLSINFLSQSLARAKHVYQFAVQTTSEVVCQVASRVTWLGQIDVPEWHSSRSFSTNLLDIFLTVAVDLLKTSILSSAQIQWIFLGMLLGEYAKTGVKKLQSKLSRGYQNHWVARLSEEAAYAIINAQVQGVELFSQLPQVFGMPCLTYLNYSLFERLGLDRAMAEKAGMLFTQYQINVGAQSIRKLWGVEERGQIFSPEGVYSYHCTEDDWPRIFLGHGARVCALDFSFQAPVVFTAALCGSAVMLQGSGVQARLGLPAVAALTFFNAIPGVHGQNELVFQTSLANQTVQAGFGFELMLNPSEIFNIPEQNGIVTIQEIRLLNRTLPDWIKVIDQSSSKISEFMSFGRIVLSDQRIFVLESIRSINSGGRGRLNIIDISNPALPAVLNTNLYLYYDSVFVVQEDKIFLTDREGAFKIFDITNRDQPQLLSSYVKIVGATIYAPGTVFDLTSVAVKGNIALVTDKYGYLNVLDITQPDVTPTLVGAESFFQPFGLIQIVSVRDSFAQDDILFIDTEYGLVIFNIANPRFPYLLFSRLPAPANNIPRAITLENNILLFPFTRNLAGQIYSTFDVNDFGGGSYVRYSNNWHARNPGRFDAGILRNDVACFVADSFNQLNLTCVSIRNRTNPVDLLASSFTFDNSNQPTYFLPRTSLVAADEMLVVATKASGIHVLKFGKKITAFPSLSDIGTYQFEIIGKDSQNNTLKASFTLTVSNVAFIAALSVGLGVPAIVAVVVILCFGCRKIKKILAERAQLEKEKKQIKLAKIKQEKLQKEADRRRQEQERLAEEKKQLLPEAKRLYYTGEYKLACERLERLKSLEETQEVLMWLGWVYQKWGFHYSDRDAHRRALGYFEQAQGRSGEHDHALCIYMGDSFSAMEEKEKAEACYLKPWQEQGKMVSTESIKEEDLGKNLAPAASKCAVYLYKGDCVLKVFNTALPTEDLPHVTLLFLRETRLYVLLGSHPGIVKALGVNFSPPSSLRLMMEYVPKGSLEELLHDEKSTELPFKTRLSIALKVVEALRYLHEREPAIIHGDIKTANILVDNENVPKLADFDCSSTENECPEQRYFAGTAGYEAPELMAKEAGCSRMADMYAFGVVLWELVFAPKTRYDGLGLEEGSEVEAIRERMKEKITETGLPYVLSSEAPLGVKPSNFKQASDLIRWCWARDRSRRPSAEALHEKLAVLTSRI